MTSDSRANASHRRSERVICVIHPNKSAYSETFIRAHIERLPAKVKVLYGGYLPMYSEDGRLFLSPKLTPRIARGVSRRLLSLSPQHFHTQAVKRYLERNKVEAVLAEYGPTGLAVMDICREASIPLVVHFHGFDAFDHRMLEEFGKQYPCLFENASSIIAASKSMRGQLLELGAPPEKIFVNHYGVDTSLFSDSNPVSSSPLFVAVGRFVDKKAPHLTLLSFRMVLEQCEDARLIMIGDGELLEACKQMVRALGISSSVQFMGVCNSTEIASVLRNARAFVQHSIQTSYGDSESLGVVFLEAGAAGLPVVSTRHDGIPEVVIDGETGFLVNEGDIQKMADCMIRLAKEPDLAQQLGKAARERISSEFNIEKSIENLWRILEETISLSGKREFFDHL